MASSLASSHAMISSRAPLQAERVLRKAMFFAMALPHSDAMFIVAYPPECTETFQDGHVRALPFFGGIAFEPIHYLELLERETLEREQPASERITHRVHILEANGESYRLNDAKKRAKRKHRENPEKPALP